MPLLLYRSRFIIALSAALLLLLSGCKKLIPADVQQNLLQQYFETNILDRDFDVHYAYDNGTDLTSQYNGYIFRMSKNTLLDGPMTATKSGITYNGTWSSNDDYSKLTINLSSPPTEFIFMAREWKFTKKALPIMELAPWGVIDNKILHMERL